MEEYKERFIKEYRELSERIDKLTVMLVKWDEGKLDFTPTCPKTLLREQLSTMKHYQSILQRRAALENILVENILFESEV